MSVSIPDTEAEPVNYLIQWTGSYDDGLSNHWSSYPCFTDSGYIYVNNSDTQDVSVTVHLGNLDSCLTLIVVYDQNTVVTNENLKFSTSGSHFSSWGGGSGAGYLSVNFSNDSLHYNYSQKCGIPCSSGIKFKIRRI